MQSQENNDISEITRIDIDKKGMYGASELDKKWKEDKSQATSRYQSKLYPDYTVAVVNEGTGGKNIYLFSKSNQNRPMVFMMMSSAAGVGWETNLTTVRTSAMGQGMGLALYIILIRELNFILVSDLSQSAGGAGLWARLFKTPGITVYGWDKDAPLKQRFFQVHDVNGQLDAADRELYYDFDDPLHVSKKSPKDYRDARKAAKRRLVAVKTIK